MHPSIPFIIRAPNDLPNPEQNEPKYPFCLFSLVALPPGGLDATKEGIPIKQAFLPFDSYSYAGMIRRKSTQEPLDCQIKPCGPLPAGA